MLGFTTSIMFYATAAAFVLGGYLVEKKMFGLTFEKIMLVFSCVIFGAQSVGQASSMMPDYAKAQVAVAKIFELLSRVPKINNWNKEGGKVLDEFEDEVKFDSVNFSYPTRPQVSVLNDFTLTIEKGQKIALVGSSGCGWLKINK